MSGRCSQIFCGINCHIWCYITHLRFSFMCHICTYNPASLCVYTSFMDNNLPSVPADFTRKQEWPSYWATLCVRARGKEKPTQLLKIWNFKQKMNRTAILVNFVTRWQSKLNILSFYEHWLLRKCLSSDVRPEFNCQQRIWFITLPPYLEQLFATILIAQIVTV